MRKLCAFLVLLALPVLAEKKVIIPPEMAGSTSPFSPGILVDGTLYCSGMIGTDAKTGKVPEEFEAEVKLAFERIGSVLKAAGMTYKDIVSVHIFLTDTDLFARMNAVYTTIVPEPRPARATVGVNKLVVPGARMEVSVIAHK